MKNTRKDIATHKAQTVQALYNDIQEHKDDNKKLWNLATRIQTDIIALHKHRREQTKELEAMHEQVGTNLSADCSDEQLRARVKQHLVNRLVSGDLSASEIAQLKDLFNLSSQTEELSITTVNYSNVCNCQISTED